MQLTQPIDKQAGEDDDEKDISDDEGDDDDDDEEEDKGHERLNPHPHGAAGEVRSRLFRSWATQS